MTFTIAVKFIAKSDPTTAPIKLPTTPDISPCQTKIDLMRRSCAPMVRKIAISAERSLTAIIKVDTILKQATPITSTITRYIIVRTI